MMFCGLPCEAWPASGRPCAISANSANRRSQRWGAIIFGTTGTIGTRDPCKPQRGGKVRVSAPLYVLWATACVVASMTVACWAGLKIGSEVAVLSAAGQNLGWILCILGLSSSALKALIPYDRSRSVRFERDLGLPTLGLWTSCLFYSWGAAVFAALNLPGVAMLPVHVLLFLAAAWGFVEIAAGLLPSLSWLAFLRLRNLPPVSHEASPLATEPRAPYARDVAELVQRIVQDRGAPAHLGISLAPDGTILTSQAALAKALGQSKATVHRRLHALYASGAITLATDGSCTRIGVAACATALAA